MLVFQIQKQCSYKINGQNGPRTVALSSCQTLKKESSQPILDNIDWKNKNISRSETHHTNSILVQKCALIDNVSKVSLDVDSNVERKSHRS